MDPLLAAIRVSQKGLAAQSTRMRVVAENLANANVTGATAGSDPYSRKTISFEAQVDDAAGAEVVEVSGIGRHNAPFRTQHDPGHPAADERGFVKLPNVDPVVELADMREAMRSYQANVQMIKNARESISMAIDLLRSGS
jgi:flagellar basal-body rod protein FlgC